MTEEKKNVRNFSQQNSIQLFRQTLFDKLLSVRRKNSHTHTRAQRKELPKSYRLQTRRRIDIWHLRSTCSTMYSLAKTAIAGGYRENRTYLVFDEKRTQNSIDNNAGAQ